MRPRPEEVTTWRRPIGWLLVAPLVDEPRLELYDVEHTGGVLRVLVDREGGVDLDAITAVTRAAVPGPRRGRPDRRALHARGVEPRPRAPAAHARPLRRAPSARRSRSRPRPASRASAASTARSPPPTTTAVTVRLADGSTPSAPSRYDEIERARTIFDWGPAPKPGEPKKPSDRKRHR